MTQRDNILQELNDLQSSLAQLGAGNVYTVPAGYFDNLADGILDRIRALNTEDPSEELNYLSPLVNAISREMPYSIPVDFFKDQDARIGQAMTNVEEQAADEEIRSLSPLLSGLKKEMPFSVPQGYFEELKGVRKADEIPSTGKVVSIARHKLFRYAAAAAIVGFIATGSIMFLSKKQTIDPKTQSSQWVEKNMKKVSTDDINSFIQLADGETAMVASVDAKNETKDKNEIQELIKDIPDKDIQNFLDDTGADNAENTDDALMN